MASPFIDYKMYVPCVADMHRPALCLVAPCAGRHQHTDLVRRLYGKVSNAAATAAAVVTGAATSTAGSNSGAGGGARAGGGYGGCGEDRQPSYHVIDGGRLQCFFYCALARSYCFCFKCWPWAKSVRPSGIPHAHSPFPAPSYASNNPRTCSRRQRRLSRRFKPPPLQPTA